MNLQRAIAAYACYIMTHNHLHRLYLTLQQAVEEVANSPESDEKDIVILPTEQGHSYATHAEEDEDVSHKNDLLPNDVAGTLETRKEHNDKENDVVSDSRAIQIEGKTSQPSKRRKKVKPAAVNWRKKQNLKEISEQNFTYLANSHPHFALFEPIALFWLLFNYEISDLIAIETKRYASQQNELFYIYLYMITLVTARFTRKRFQSSWDYTRKPHNEAWDPQNLLKKKNADSLTTAQTNVYP